MKFFNAQLLILICLVSACEKTDNITQAEQKAIIEQAITEREELSQEPVSSNEAPIPVANVEGKLENNQYLFDASTHSLEDLERLLSRAEEISDNDKTNYDELEIVMILHGPDINWFNETLPENESLIQLAEKLDNKNIIDLRVCDRAIENYGYNRANIPSFIESVPFAPTEIQERLDEGYINL